MELHEEFLSYLNINEERAKEILEKVFEIASDCWKNKTSLIPDKVPEFYLIAKNKEEAFFVGAVVAFIATDIALANNPSRLVKSSKLTIRILERVRHGRG